MKLVSNTGPLIALAKLDHLVLLKEMMPEGVMIPPAVQKELWGKVGSESKALESALETFLQVKKLRMSRPMSRPRPFIWMKEKSRPFGL